jgi:hypothetical protein
MVLAGTWSVKTARPRIIGQVNNQLYDAPGGII